MGLMISIYLSGCDTWPLRQHGNVKPNTNIKAHIERAKSFGWQEIDCTNIQPGETEAREKYGQLLKKSGDGKLACIEKAFSSKKFEAASISTRVRAVIFEKKGNRGLDYEVWADRGLPNAMHSVADANKELMHFGSQ